MGKPAETQGCVEEKPRPQAAVVHQAGNAPVRIMSIQYDAPGDDRKKETWNGEWVVLEGSDVSMAGWSISDGGNHSFSFPPGFVISGQVKLHSGDGSNTASDLYWNCCRRPIWNNDADVATLVDGAGNLVDRYTYKNA